MTEEYLEEVCRQYQSEKGVLWGQNTVAIFRRPHTLTTGNHVFAL